jgi:hypothetical protein
MAEVAELRTRLAATLDQARLELAAVVRNGRLLHRDAPPQSGFSAVAALVAQAGRLNALLRIAATGDIESLLVCDAVAIAITKVHALLDEAVLGSAVDAAA